MRKTSLMLAVENTVISYICDRESAIVWGTKGGLPSSPHGLTLTRAGGAQEQRLGTIFSDVPIGEGGVFSRPTADGGGYGDPLLRLSAQVLEDVLDDYVSVERAAKDYGVVLQAIDVDLGDYALDLAATDLLRAEIRWHRVVWARTDPEEVANRFRIGEIGTLDAIRRYAVIFDWDTGELLPNSTRQFREGFEQRSVANWTSA